MRIFLAQESDLERYVEHLRNHIGESGKDGDPIFAPIGPEFFDEPKSTQRILSDWKKKLDEPGWERVWALEIDGHIVGHLDARGGSIPATVHRTVLGMGIERKFRGKGYGKTLLKTAIDWCSQVPSISWIDLRVFAHNKVALNLYRNFEFTELGRTPDCIRVNGKNIEDIYMTRPNIHKKESKA